ncbi:MAG TPA: restriction endonuclease [Flavobacterium sp.]|nr:restriction endonuclease [Flavobacterium sp.]
MSIQAIEKLLNQQNIKGQQGRISFDLAGIKFPVVSKDIIGGILQEWFEEWMKVNNISFTKPVNPQEPPDFYLSNNEHLEIKSFNHDANPAFDLANFDAYTRSLIAEPTRLDSEHLIFGYRANLKTVEIVNFWVKKIWEMTGKSDKNCLNLQVKQGVPTNIRPKDWRGRGATFSCRRDFVLALDDALNKFYPNRYQNWFTQVETEYKRKTGNFL